MAPILVIWTVWLLAWAVDSIGYQRGQWSTALITGLVAALGLLTYLVPYSGTIAPYVGGAALLVLLAPALDAALRPGAVAGRERTVWTVGVLLHPLVILLLGSLWPILRGTTLMVGMFLPFTSETAQLSVVAFSGAALLVCGGSALRQRQLARQRAVAAKQSEIPNSPK